MPARYLPVVMALLALIGCAPSGLDGFWRTDTRYALSLNAATDSLVLNLAVDSIARDTVFGSATGTPGPFPVMFRAVGGDRFVGTRDRERWAIRLNSQAIDTGLLLSGELSHGRLRGGWTPPFESRHRGTFSVAPAT